MNRADSDAPGHRGHPQQAGPLGRPGQPHVQRQGDAAGPDPLDPPAQPGRVEAHVAHDVGRVPALVPHGLDGDVVVDLGVALRVPGDPDPGERVTHLGQPFQQRQRALERPGRVRRVPARHEHVVHAARPQPLDDLRQVRVAGHRPGGQVRDHPVAAAGQLLGELDGRLQPLDRRRGDGHRHPGRHPLGHGLLGPLGRDHLEPGPGKQTASNASRPLIANPRPGRRARTPAG